MATGPELWTSNPINLHSFAASLGALVPGAPESSEPRIGIDYIPPLNAVAIIRAPSTALAVVAPPTEERIPEYFSWNDVDSIRTVKQWNVTQSPILSPQSQLSCGACWAFAIVGALSDRYAIYSGGTNPNLSPSYLLSCMGTEERCNGGNPADGGKFLEQHGTVSSSCWDYTWCTSKSDCVHGSGSASSIDLSRLVPECRPHNCAHNCSSVQRGGPSSCETSGEMKVYRAKPSSTQSLVDRRSIQIDILEHGPVAAVGRIFGGFVAGTLTSDIYPKADGWAKTKGVFVHVTNRDIYDYGTIDCLGASQNATQCFLGNHAMVIVGWGVEKAVPNFLGGTNALDLPYWIVRNSWGTEWNGNGYCKIAMSDPDTGINMAVALDRPLRISGHYFGAVTTILPDIPLINVLVKGTTIMNPPISIITIKTVRANLKVVLFTLLVVTGCVILYFVLRKTRSNVF